MKQAGFEQVVGGGDQGLRVDDNLNVVINRLLALLLFLHLYKARCWINEYGKCNFPLL